jgi:outer membrane protein
MNPAFRTCLRSVVCLLLLGLGLRAGAQPAEPAPRPRTIAVIRDEPSWLATPLEAKVRRSLEEMAAGRMEIAFREFASAEATPDVAELRAQLAAALADPEVDYVLVLGARAALVAADPALPLGKPVLGAAIVDPVLAPLPLDAEGRPTKPNFAVVALAADSGEMLRHLRTLVPFGGIQVLVDEHFAASPAVIEEWRGRLARELGAEVRLVPLGATAAPALAALDPAAKAVFLLPAVRQSEAEHAALLAGLVERRMQVLSFVGRAEVEAGALAGLLPESGMQLSRRVALAFDQLETGAAISGLSLRLPIQPALCFNETTAAAVGFSPNFGALHDATLVSPYAPGGGKPLSLRDAIATALERNYALRARQAGTEASRQDVKAAAGQLQPQLAALSTYQRIDLDRAQASGGIYQEKTWFAGFGMSQTIVDDEAIARVRVARAALQAADAVERAQRLDTGVAAAQAYLQLLSARAALRVTEQNARATDKHLELANLRQRVGTSGPEDIYRFESLAAQQRSEVIAARMQVERARTNLNRVLGVDATAQWEPGDVSLDDPAFASITAPMAALVDERQRFVRLQEYMTTYAAAHSPDIDAAEQGVRALRLSADQKGRRSYVPKIAATANFGRLYELDYGGPTLTEQLMRAGLPVHPVDLNRTVWTVGVQATVPLYTGGSLTADTRKARAQLRQAEFTRDGAREAVVAATQAGLFSIESSYSAIALSRTAADLAARNLEVIRRKYEEGTVSIVTLLEAQNAAFAQRQAADVAVYRFLGDVIAVQRLCGRMEALATPEENAAWLAEIEAALSNR